MTSNQNQAINSSPRIALYPGSFDFLTNGHMDIISRSASLFDKVFVAVAHNASKTPFFTMEERVEILRQATQYLPNVEVNPLEGLTVEYAENKNAQFIVRGLRAVTDFEYELQIAIMNHELRKNIETIFLAANPKHIFLSSRVVRDVWRHGGDITHFVPAATFEALKNRAD